MNRHSKIIAALLTAVFALSLCTVPAYAEEPDNNPGIIDQGGEQGGNEQGGGDQGGNEQGGGEQGGNEQGGGEQGGDIQGGGDSQGSSDYQGGGDIQGGGSDQGGETSQGGGDTNQGGDQGGSGYIDYNQGGGDSGYSDYNQGGGNVYGGTGNSDGDTVYYGSDGNTYSDYSEIYVGGDQVYTPPATIAPSAALYDTSNVKVDDKTLSSNDWNDIKAALSGSKTTGSSDGDDFAFIQNNASTGDNGHMIFVIGLTLVILSLIGFIYLIASAVSRRRKAPARSGSSSSGGRYRSDDDYNDGYSSTKTAKRTSRYDTADIPKVTASKTTKTSKSKGGKRYR